MEVTKQEGEERHFVNRASFALRWWNHTCRIPVPPFGAERKMFSAEQFTQPIAELCQYDRRSVYLAHRRIVPV